MAGDWYARHMYMEGSDQYRYHLRKYGHPSKFGYKDIIPLWKAEKFDPEGLMDLYVKRRRAIFRRPGCPPRQFPQLELAATTAGIPCNMGPKKDIVRLWQARLASTACRFGFSEHIGATFTWYMPNKGADQSGPYAGVPYDGSDPAYEDLYLPNRAADRRSGTPTTPGGMPNGIAYVKELIDLYQPDLLYSDGGVPFGRVRA